VTRDGIDDPDAHPYSLDVTGSGSKAARMRLTIGTLALALAGAASLQDQTAPRLAAEIDRARAALEASAPADERGAPIARLDRAKAALDAGRLYLAAYLAESPWEAGVTWTFVKASADVTTEEAFERKWTAIGAPRPVPAPQARVPAVIAALAAIAEARGPATYQASRPYAQDSGLFGGLYYLGDAHAVMQFAATVRAMGWPGAATAPAFRSIAAEIAAFDAEMTTAYEKMERTNHPTYISASAALKQARTLNEGSGYGGALFEYLLARYLFAPLRGPASAEATAARIEAARAALPGGGDHSIAEFFLQLAAEGLTGTDAQRRGTAAVLDDVLPAYVAATSAAATTASAAGGAKVTITLVRWPFT